MAMLVQQQALFKSIFLSAECLMISLVLSRMGWFGMISLESFCLENMLSPSPSPQHKSHSEEPSYARPFNDRKRKFVDSELALDTEGNWLYPNPTPI